MNKCILICFVLSLIFLLNFASAVSISVYREAPSQVKLNSIIQINITVENKDSFERNITIKEMVGNFESVSPQPITPTGTSGMIELAPPYYEWNFMLQASSKRTVYYTVKFAKPGEIILSPTNVYVDNELVSNDAQIVKVVCNQNKICEPDLNENYFTCKEDCPSGSADGICDLLSDGICDIDCADNTDIDCKKQGKCGNGICEQNENYNNCKIDCHGLADGICDKVIDNICDSDCLKNEDSDCLKKQMETKKIILYAVAFVCLLILVFALYKLYQRMRWRKLEQKYKK